MRKVVKFGGSSLASAEQFRKVGEIIRADESRRYVVPSAPGKRFPLTRRSRIYYISATRQQRKGERSFRLFFRRSRAVIRRS